MDRSKQLLKDPSIPHYYLEKTTCKRFTFLMECKIGCVLGISLLRKGEMFITTKADFDLRFEREFK